MKHLIYIFLSLIAILTIGVICCNRAVINTATDRMYDDVAAIPYKRVGVLLGTNPKGRRGNPNHSISIVSKLVQHSTKRAR